MSNIFANPALQNKSSNSIGFNLVTQNSPFNSVFNSQPLDKAEEIIIEKLLVENFLLGSITEEQVALNINEIKTLTSEIKAISRQGIVLIGERVFKAREILKQYKDGTFTKWLETAFGTRKTGYNLLSYYELYNALPNNILKENLKKLPQRAAYILASREGNIEAKAQIINSCHNLSADEIITRIQEKFPLMETDKRLGKEEPSKLIVSLHEILIKIQKQKSSLTSADKNSLIDLKNLIDLVTKLEE